MASAFLFCPSLRFSLHGLEEWRYQIFIFKTLDNRLNIWPKMVLNRAEVRRHVRLPRPCLPSGLSRNPCALTVVQLCSLEESEVLQTSVMGM